jgi:spore coat polysaccharide biosynthesis protein SpsF (cytidylyltransferase family)
LEKDIIIITQARVGSSRLRDKLFLKAGRRTLLNIHLNRLKKVKKASLVILSTTHEKGVNKIIDIAKEEGISFFQGSTDNVLDRFYKSVKKLRPDFIVRVTSDCPLIDPNLIDDMITFAIQHDLDYISNGLINYFPDGQDVEVVKFKSLHEAWKNAKLKSELEHVTPYIINNSDFKGKTYFKAKNFKINLKKDYSKVRMTVDYYSDFETINTLINNLGFNKNWIEYSDFILENKELFSNQMLTRNESFYNQLLNEKKKY